MPEHKSSTHTNHGRAKPVTLYMKAQCMQHLWLLNELLQRIKSPGEVCAGAEQLPLPRPCHPFNMTAEQNLV